MQGLLHLSWLGDIIATLILTQITIISVTLYLHRYQAHRALTLHPAVSHFFRFWLWLTTGTVTKEWAAVHRKHHAKVESEEDPHSPQTRGIKKVFFEGAELYQAEADIQETLDRYGEGTPDDWMERNVYTGRRNQGIFLMFLIDISLFGIIGITVWAVQMMWIPLFAAGVINGIGHYWGYRNYEPKDASRNIVPWGVFLGGEELHNNHHAFATSAKFSAKWWEIDTGWLVIRTLQLFSLAKPKRSVPKLTRIASKKTIDTDTISALIQHRLQVLSQYSKTVVMPAWKAEKKRAGKLGKNLLRRAKVALIREDSLLEAAQQMSLVNLFQQFHSLKVVYQFRQKLQAIWNKRTASQKELIEAVQEWCQQAEETGLEVLREFAAKLKTYVPQAGS